MDDKVVKFARQLLDRGLTSLSDREQRVVLLIARRQHVTRDMKGWSRKNQSFGERLADGVAQLGGSWSFILVFPGMMAG